MSYPHIKRPGTIGYNPSHAVEITADTSSTFLPSDFYSCESKLLQSTMTSKDYDFQRRYDGVALKPLNDDDFCDNLSLKSQHSASDTLETISHSHDYSYQKPVAKNDEVIRYPYLFDEESPKQAFSNENCNDVACSDGASMHEHNAFLIEGNLESPITANLKPVNTEGRFIQNYLDDLGNIDVNESETTSSENRTLSIIVNDVKCRDESDHYLLRKDQQTLVNRTYCDADSGEQRSRNPSQAIRSLESRDRVETDEVKGKKNGEELYSRTSEACRVVEQAEFQHPQANFHQRGFAHKLGLSEHAAESNVDQSSSMLIAADDRTGGQTDDLLLACDTLNTSCIGKVVTPKSSSTSPRAENYMTPDLQTDISQRTGAESRFVTEMQSRREDKGKSVKDYGLLHEQMINGHVGVTTDDKSKNNQIANMYSGASGVARKHGTIRHESQESAIAKAAEQNTTMDGHQNGDSVETGEKIDDNSSLSKHIYPWMKETRQNAKRKQSTSSNSSNNGDKSSKRERTAYTNAQLVELEKEFHFNRYLCRPRRIEMAQMLNLTERQIKIWFQNRRMKYKKDQKLKAIPLGREGAFYHQHHHSPNMASDPILSRHNGHRHYQSSGSHFHPGDGSYGALPNDNTGSTSCGMNCSTGPRCYHPHRQHGSHVSQDNTLRTQHPLTHVATSSFEPVKNYPAPARKGNTAGRLTSPSSVSSTGTLSPGNGRASAFGSEGGVRSTSSNGSEVQVLSQSGCGFMPHNISPQQTQSAVMDEDPAVLQEKSIPSSESRLVMNPPGYEIPFPGNGFPMFQRHLGDIASRMPLRNGGSIIAPEMPMSNHFNGIYDRTKHPTILPSMGNDTMVNVRAGNRRYGQFHNPLESLSDCVQRSPTEFPSHSRHFTNQINSFRQPPSDIFSGTFISGHCGSDRFERTAVEQSPVDFSRSKSSSPRMQLNDAYMNNRLTHL